MKLFYSSFFTASVLVAPVIRAEAGPVDGEACYETCGFDGVNTKEIGICLQRSIEEGGLGSAVEDAMMDVYDSVVQADIQPGEYFGDATAAERTLLAGLNTLKIGASLANSEGLYFCILNGSNAFYWVLNCDVLRGLSPADEPLCADLTAEEAAIGTVGYVVDEALVGDDKFHRYVFDDKNILETVQQPLENDSFVCNERPWFRTSLCTEPLAVTCPTGFQGTTGRGAFQVYGDTSEVVVAQDVREWQLAPCLDQDEDDGSSTNTTAIIVGSVVGGVLLLIILFLAYRLYKLKKHTSELEKRGEAVPRMSVSQKISSVRFNVSDVVEKARRESMKEGATKNASGKVAPEAPLEFEEGVDVQEGGA
mmetsp:Transcript_11157/g.22822  ORF Transcript_11157/g.22822 Transcript_11157/m.22822 type:complete len:365 (-) Transcript_11157:1472-2566(-)|eukprot:CAMPEP_0178688492 /NCGR_PEP_ID=MMETSP0699-20121125/5019_1 /TAXON_ID=265572 /ORGANISM="Extubocellulus spinifer, Strain CCMP396" /LENGTH=364 /DNA_ID=CAMNT_0020333463 /DNA_START=318 /DNA_END=1412 /DNA_ORIENTATION=-